MYAYLFLGKVPLCTLLLEPCTFIDFGKYIEKFRKIYEFVSEIMKITQFVSETFFQMVSDTKIFYYLQLKIRFFWDFLAFFHPARLLEPFSPYTFIYISKNVHSARLFQPARLLGT